MTRRQRTTTERRPGLRERHSGGRSVAQRALGQIRLVAVALILLGAAGYRAEQGAPISRHLMLLLAGGGAAMLLLVALLTTRAARAATGGHSRVAAAGTVADSVVVLGVIWMAGLPPASFALVLLLLPFLEAALWFGLPGLGGLWTACCSVLGVLVVVFPDQVPDDAIRILVVAMPTLLLATMPVSMLAEHLVAQVGQLGEAREAADDRALLLGDLSAITADIFRLDGDAVLAQLVRGAQQLGAVGVTVLEPSTGRHARPELVSAGDQQALAAATSADASRATGEGSCTVMTRELAVPGGEPCVLTALVTGAPDELGRRVEAVDLLVAQARVSLANAVLVQQLEQLKQTYEEQATLDQLTGLLNRRGLVSRAQQLPGRFGVLFCDLDGFKSVNDTMGHAAGDELLQQVARRLQGQIRSDSVLGRMGGDEFVVVAPSASDEELKSLADRLEQELARPFMLGAGLARIGVSIGTAHIGDDEQDLEELLSRADHLMYEIKRDRKAAALADGERSRVRS